MIENATLVKTEIPRTSLKRMWCDRWISRYDITRGARFGDRLIRAAMIRDDSDKRMRVRLGIVEGRDEDPESVFSKKIRMTIGRIWDA